ncbi:hypothetical protein BG003_002743, partial [Podila horticola]
MRSTTFTTLIMMAALAMISSVMSCQRLYVGGLNYSVDDDGLKRSFEPFGEVKFVKVIRDFHS